MEIVQKLVAVALVSVVSSANGFQLSVALSLGMAATSALVQPYAQPQALMDSQFLFETFGYISIATKLSFGGSSLPSSCDAFHGFQSGDMHQDVYNDSCP